MRPFPSRPLARVVSSVAAVAMLLVPAAVRSQSAYPMAPWPPTLAASHPLDAYWTGEFGYSELNGFVSAMLVDEYRVVLGGTFSGLGDVPARNVLSWDGTTFAPLGGGLPNPVRSLTRWGGLIVAGLVAGGAEGGCTNDVWTFDGNDWTPIGCFSGSVTALATYRGDLVVAPIGSALHRWDGATWNRLATGSLNETSALLPLGDSLFVGSTGSTLPVRVWNGTSLTNVGGTLSSSFSTVRRLSAMVAWNGSPVIAGNLNTENGVARGSTILRFDGSQWVGLGNVSGESSGLAIRNGELVTSIRVGAEYLVHQFTGGAWVPVDTSGAATGSTSLAVVGDTILTRSLTRIGSTTVSTPAMHAGGSWQPLRQSWSATMRGARVTSTVRLLSWQGELLAGGSSRVGATAGSISVPGGIPRWDGNEWTPHPTGGTQPGAATLRIDSTGALHGITATVVVRWDGSTWVVVSPAFSTGWLTDFGFESDRIVVCADWSTSIESPSGVARLESGAWQSIGGCDFVGLISFYQRPRVIGTWRDRLVVGGDAGVERTCDWVDFEMTQGLAMYDGSAWSMPLQEAVGSLWLDVGTMVEHEGDLIVGGGPETFYPFGTQPSETVRLDGAHATPLAAGAWATTALASIQGRLLAGGVFVRLDSTLGYGVAEWNGTRWDLLGSGTNGPVTSIAEYGGDLYIAGAFAWANGKPSHGIARLAGFPRLGAPGRGGAAAALLLGAPNPNPSRGPQRVTFTLPHASHVRASVHDVSGRRVATLLDGPRAAGTHALTWDGRGPGGGAVAPGLYFLRVRTDAGAAGATLVRLE